jgi:hypothetical protein
VLFGGHFSNTKLSEMARDRLRHSERQLLVRSSSVRGQRVRNLLKYAALLATDTPQRAVAFRAVAASALH